MKKANHELTTAPIAKRYLHGLIDRDKVFFKPAPLWAYDYLKTRDRDVFAALARADSEDE